MTYEQKPRPNYIVKATLQDGRTVIWAESRSDYEMPTLVEAADYIRSQWPAAYEPIVVSYVGMVPTDGYPYLV